MGLALSLLGRYPDSLNLKLILTFGHCLLDAVALAPTAGSVDIVTVVMKAPMPHSIACSMEYSQRMYEALRPASLPAAGFLQLITHALGS
jgi:hypothetical protein